MRMFIVATAMLVAGCTNQGMQSAVADAEAPGSARECGVIAGCAVGFVWSDVAYQCLPEQSGGGSETCGDRVCGANDYCCNDSCGICVPEGYWCMLDELMRTNPGARSHLESLRAHRARELTILQGHMSP